MVRISFLWVLLATAPCFLRAQTVPERMAPAKAEVFVGYSYLARDYRHTQLNPVSGGMSGWSAGYDAPRLFGRHVGLATDFSGHYGVGGPFTPQLYFAIAGPRYSLPVGRSTVFVHTSAGVIVASGEVIAQTSSSAAFLTALGGGLDYPIRQRLGWRFGGDWLHGGFQSNDTNQISQIVKNNFRLSTGPVLRF